MVRAQQEPVLHTRMAARRVGNRGESHLRLVNPKSVAPRIISLKRVASSLLKLAALPVDLPGLEAVDLSSSQVVPQSERPRHRLGHILKPTHKTAKIKTATQTGNR
jgi:hypothetical protein